MVRGENVLVRTAADLERKYDFSAITGLKQNVEQQLITLNQINQELYNVLSTLVINMNDVLDFQSEITLWFYAGTPGASVAPESSWIDPDTRSEHEGDIYYDRASGKVYVYSSTYEWAERIDPRLVQAMALSEHKLNGDEQRQVFFVQPSPPYESGDWWVKDSGDLFMCQVGRATGVYIDNDFISSANFSSANATATSNTLTVISGSVLTVKQGSDNVASTVAGYQEFKDATTGALVARLSDITTLQQTSTSIAASVVAERERIDYIDNYGVSRVETKTTNFTLDTDGLKMNRTGEQLGMELGYFVKQGEVASTMGMLIKRTVGATTTTMLEATSDGVIADNVTVNNYLTMGHFTRVEDYVHDEENETGFFYIG